MFSGQPQLLNQSKKHLSFGLRTQIECFGHMRLERSMPEYYTSTVQTFMIVISGVAPRQQASEQLWEMSMSHEHDTLTIRKES